MFERSEESRNMIKDIFLVFGQSIKSTISVRFNLTTNAIKMT